jgi:hypothetical protein
VPPNCNIKYIASQKRYINSVQIIKFATLTTNVFILMRPKYLALTCIFLLGAVPYLAGAQTVSIPDWALPGSPTHKQVAPPPGFHRPARTKMMQIGIFDGQSDIGGALVKGNSTYNAATKKYSITSAGYNVWYNRDEFRYLWKKMSGDVSLAADISFPDPKGFGDRKILLVIRQSLNDDSKEAIVALHGGGMVHLAQRPGTNLHITDMEYSIGGRGSMPGSTSPDDLVTAYPKRIGIEKHGDYFALFVSMDGEPMHQFGAPIHLRIDRPFYVGIGFCSHLPAQLDTGVLNNVLLVNASGKMK